MSRALWRRAAQRGPWSQAWLDWPGYGPFWAQLVRAIARPPVSPDAELPAVIHQERLKITLDLRRRRQNLRAPSVQM